MKMKTALYATALMMAAAMQANNSYGRQYVSFREDPFANETPEERKIRLHRIFGNDQQLHEFTIKGETIMATNKKTAMKIYANRHLESRKKKK